MEYCTIQDVEALWRELTPDEQTRAEALIPVVTDSLRQEALNCNKNLDVLVADGKIIENVLKSVIVDVVARVLMTSTDQEPMSQFSESALGYSFSGTYLNGGGGIFIKNAELRRLGLKRQRISNISMI